MISKSAIEKESEFQWVIPSNHDPRMNVPVTIFGNEQILAMSLNDKSIQQAIHASCLPGVVRQICVMPDVHQGYGFPIGGVAAMDLDTGVISPGAIGYDINCGVRLLSTSLSLEEANHFIGELIDEIHSLCPSGLGKKGLIVLSRKDIDQVCVKGAGWALENGYAYPEDINRIEDLGCLPYAEKKSVSDRAMERGLSQLGSLGSGNHFIEIDKIEQIYDEAIAHQFGLVKENLVIQIHTGSRGFGHQICTDFVKEFQGYPKKFGFSIPDRELACAPFRSREGQKYLAAMACAANYAFCNRQILTHFVRQAFRNIFPNQKGKNNLKLVYDLAHNIGKIETHEINGKKKRLFVHRKGATRAFGANHPELLGDYQKIGQPVLLPGSMGSSSWVLIGREGKSSNSFYSCAHGAGRVMSRTKAKKLLNRESILQQLFENGIRLKSGSKQSVVEEAPQAYKDISLVVDSVQGAGLADPVARIYPIAVIKG